MSDLKNIRKHTLFNLLVNKKQAQEQIESFRYCTHCAAPRMGDICWKCYSNTHTPASEYWVNPYLPDIAKIVEIGNTFGYAVAVHGSLERDLDLIAVPWSEITSPMDDFIRQLCLELNAKVLGQEIKPKGRIAYSIQIDGYYKLIDLSVIPI